MKFSIIYLLLLLLQKYQTNNNMIQTVKHAHKILVHCILVWINNFL